MSLMHPIDNASLGVASIGYASLDDASCDDASCDDASLDDASLEDASLNPHQNDKARKGPCFFQRLIALKCLKGKKI
jgi:hypothetical protein